MAGKKGARGPRVKRAARDRKKKPSTIRHPIHYRFVAFVIVEIYRDDGRFAAWCRNQKIMTARTPKTDGEITSHYFAVCDGSTVLTYLREYGIEFAHPDRYR